MRLPKISKTAFLLLALFLTPLVFADESRGGPAENTPGSTSLDFANGLYSRKMYGPAISEYDKFIRSNPGSPEIASARFRSADSTYFIKDYAQAAASFESFLKDFPKDARVPMAKFRWATAKFYLKEYRPAQKEFFRLARGSEDPVIRSGSLFYFAKVYETAGRSHRLRKLMDRVIVNYPDSEYAAYAEFSLGEDLLKTKDRAGAARYFQMAADRLQPEAIAREARLKVAEIRFEQKDFAAAAGDYGRLFNDLQKTLTGAAPPDARDLELRDKALLGLFYCDAGVKNTDAALARYKENESLLAQSRVKAQTLTLLAELVFEKKDFNACLGFLDGILFDAKAEQTLKEKALFKKAEALSELGQYPAGLAAYQEVIKQNSKEFIRQARFGLGFLQLKMGDAAAARASLAEFLEKYPDDPSAPRALLEAVQIDLDAKRFEDAAGATERFLKSYVSSPLADIAYYKLGVARSGLKDFKAAGAAFAQVIDHYPQSQLFADSLYGAAVSLESADQLKEAVAVYERFLKDYPQHALYQDALTRLGVLYVQTENFEKAGAIYQDIFLSQKNYPVESDVALWLVRYLLDQSRYDEMMQLLQVLPQRYPKEDLNHAIHFFLGESAMGKKDFIQAIEQYTQAIGANPNGDYVPHATLGIGRANAAQGKWGEAENYFQKALSYDYETTVAMRARFELANLHLATGELEEAAKSFMLVAILYDDEKYCPLALYKAWECFNKLNKTDDAAKALQELKSRYPQSEWAKK